MNTFRFIEDPGHGWLEVPVTLLKELGITEQISGYSYLNGAFAYLEEDVDMAVFLKAMAARGRTVERVELFQDPTPIRGYPSYEPTHLRTTGATA